MNTLSENKTPFYLFVDIDGLLTDWNIYDNYDYEYDINIPAPHMSMKPLTYLIRVLHEHYDVKLICTTITTIHDDAIASYYLRKNGLGYYKPIEFITVGLGQRNPDVIYRYIDKHHIKDYAIIDDDVCDNMFRSSTIVVPNLADGLTYEMVDKYLENKFKNSENNP